MDKGWLGVFFGLMSFIGMVVQWLVNRAENPPDPDKVNELGTGAASHEGSSEVHEEHAHHAKEEAASMSGTADTIKEEADAVHAKIEEIKKEEAAIKPPADTSGMTPEEIDDAFKKDGF